MATEMDALVLGDHLLLKERQPAEAVSDPNRHLAQFVLD
jgi:hypothetical protein